MRSLTVIALSLLAFSCNSPRTSEAVVPYPLDTCIVTENALGSMGNPITKVYGNQEVKFCCRPCVAEFENNMDTYLAVLED